ncbi:hypothetical protein JNUCC1_00054 [Lentibacillus sp. JNUCC-1]|nr:hypothetical protein [Lentibacillus sp. JNUCC-1]
MNLNEHNKIVTVNRQFVYAWQHVTILAKPTTIKDRHAVYPMVQGGRQPLVEQPPSTLFLANSAQQCKDLSLTHSENRVKTRYFNNYVTDEDF